MKAVYALSADPITYGHIDIIKRAANVFDKVVVAIGTNAEKKYMFGLEERLDMAKKSLSKLTNIDVTDFQGLLVDFAYKNNIFAIAKGIRNSTDLDNERTQYLANLSQRTEIETLWLPARLEVENISSSTTKALQAENGDIYKYVPLYVKQRLETRMSGQYFIGITGEIGSGKSYVGKKIEELCEKQGIPVNNIELDALAHKIYTGDKLMHKEVRKKLADAFNINDKFPIDRKKLGDLVFSDPEKLRQLNEIMYDPIMSELREEIRGKKGLIIINTALIAEQDFSYLCNNNILIIKANRSAQEKRLSKRGLSSDKIDEQLASQYSYEKKKQVIEKHIAAEGNGKIWEYDNSKEGSEGIEESLSRIIKDVDVFGELRFNSLWNRIGAKGSANAEYRKIVGAYLQSHRYYHTLSHIMMGLNEIDSVRPLMDNPDAAELAWWYHDFVYEIDSNLNEEKSSDVVYRVCIDNLVPKEFASLAKSLVMETKHAGRIKVGDGEFIRDLDLLSFGMDGFMDRSDKIRKEYVQVSDRKFDEGNSRFMKRFLEKEQIFLSNYFRNKYEKRARENLLNAT